MFKGSNVALVTPFKNNKLDEENYIKIINFHLKNNTNGLVPAGTTGESPTLNHDEHQKVIDLCIKESNGKISVIAGTGSNSTEEAISLTVHAEKAGADGALIVTPYYNKPTQEGLYQHYKAINDACGIPLIIYNIPSRSVIDMSVDTMARLFELKNIIGVKDATGNLDRVDQQKKKMGPDFIQLTGEDGNALEFNRRGGVGCISVTANIAPKLCSDFQRFSVSKSDNEIKEAERIDQVLQPVHKSLFIESNPGPVKYAAKLLNLCNDDVRLPLVQVTDSTKEAVKKGFETVMCPGQFCYFDMAYNNSTYEQGICWAATIEVSDVHAWQPLNNIDPKYHSLVAGIQGQLWSETLTQEHYIDSMINPRLATLAEVAWSSNNRRNWNNFRSALFQSMQLTTKLGWNYHDF